MDIFFDEKYNGVLGHIKTKGHTTIHQFLNTSFNKYIDAHNNITVSKAIVYVSAEKIKKMSDDLYSIFYDTPNECEGSQYSEFFSAVLYNSVYDANKFQSEGTIIKKLRKYHDSMNGISPPDMYMSNVRGNALLVSVTRFNSQKDHRVRAYTLLATKIAKAQSSILATNPIFGTDRCIIQIFCKSEYNATMLKNTWDQINNIPPWIYLHIIICQHDEIYKDNGFFN